MHPLELRLITALANAAKKVEASPHTATTVAMRLAVIEALADLTLAHFAEPAPAGPVALALVSGDAA